jgi:hypothetical protein
MTRQQLESKLHQKYLKQHQKLQKIPEDFLHNNFGDPRDISPEIRDTR